MKQMTFKNYEVKMIPTDGIDRHTGALFKDTIDGKLRINPHAPGHGPNDRTYYHLYFVSDQEIKEGDHYFNPYYNKVFLANDILVANHKTGMFNEFKKVSAATDTSLLIEESGSARFGHHDNIGHIPGPSRESIDHFLTEYNKGNILTEVQVEHLPNKYPDLHGIEYEMRINPDNTINIKTGPTKDTDPEINTAIEFGKWIATNVHRFTPNYKGVDKTTWWVQEYVNNKHKPDPIPTEELFDIFISTEKNRPN